MFHWLILRCGVETIKPDVWVINFGQRVVGQRLSEEKLIKAFTDIAPLVGESLSTIDGTIWHFERNAMATTDSPALRIVWWHMLKLKLDAELDAVLLAMRGSWTWQLSLDGKEQLRHAEAGLTITLSPVDADMVPSVWILRQSVWYEGFGLTLLLRKDHPMEPSLFDQLKTKLVSKPDSEKNGLEWELENEPVFTATLDMETSLHMAPETSVEELTDLVSEITKCFFDALVDFEIVLNPHFVISHA